MEFIKNLRKSTTFKGIILGLAALAVGVGLLWEDAPANFAKIIGGISVFLVIFGLMDAANQELATWVEKIKAYMAKQPMIGFYIVVLVEVIDKVAAGALTGVSPNLVIFAQGLGFVITLLGLRTQIIRARANTTKRHPYAVEKYEAIVS